MESNYINSNKLLIFYQSAKKGSLSFVNNKKEWITFVGKLNRAKGYDIFSKAIKIILNKYPDWKALIIGDEKREKNLLNHKNATVKGFKKQKD